MIIRDKAFTYGLKISQEGKIKELGGKLLTRKIK